MLVATFSLEASPALIAAFIFFVIVGFYAYVNVGSKWLTKVINDYKKSRKAKKPVPIQPRPNWNYDESAPIPDRIAYVIRYWLETVDADFAANPAMVSGRATSVIQHIAICDAGVHFGLLGRWFCELDRHVFYAQNLLDLITCLEPVLPVEHIHVAPNLEGNIILYFYRIHEPAH